MLGSWYEIWRAGMTRGASGSKSIEGRALLITRQCVVIAVAVSALVSGAIAGGLPSAMHEASSGEPALFTPFWDHDPRPSAGPRAAARVATPLASQTLPQDAAWEGWVTPGPLGNTHRFVEWQGKLVIAGGILAGHTSHEGLVTWDGTEYEALPSAGGTPFFLTTWNDDLVVVVSAPLPNARSIKRWNGTTWDLLGVTNDRVECIQGIGTKLVVGGYFTSVEGVAANRIAWYDGVGWSAIGAGFADRAVCLAEHAGQLHVGVRPPSGNVVFRWNAGSGIWEPLGAGVTGAVVKFVSDGANLYAAGGSLASGGTEFGGLARWDGSGWNAIPGAVGKSSNDATLWNGRVITTMSLPPVGRLSQWDGVSLTAIPGDSLGYGVALTNRAVFLGTWGARLVVNGTFVTNGAQRIPSFALYDGTSWSTIGIPWDATMRSPNSDVHTMIEWNGKLLVTWNSGLVADQDRYVFGGGVAAFDGTHWAPISDNTVFAMFRYMCVWNGDLVFGGYNIQISGTNIQNMARWDGTNWHALGPDAPNFVNAMAAHQGDLYAANNLGFHDGLARWNGSSWSGLGTGFPGGGDAWALCTHDDELVAGGSFSNAGGVPANSIAAWDGSAWHAFGDGFVGTVNAVTSWNGVLVAGGSFTASGLQPLDGAAYWDGTSWHPMGSNVTNIWYLGIYYGELFASGMFRLPDNSEIETLAKWNGTDWQILGSGVHSGGSSGAFAFHGDHLYYAGTGIIHGHPSHALARTPLSAVLDAPRPRVPGSSVALAATPNPSRSVTRFTLQLPTAGHLRLSILDLTGRMIATLADGEFPAGEHDVRWDAPAAPGVYFARLEAPGGAKHVTRVVRLD
jgi:hypothetical protein